MNKKTEKTIKICTLPAGAIVRNLGLDNVIVENHQNQVFPYRGYIVHKIDNDRCSVYKAPKISFGKRCKKYKDCIEINAHT